VAAGRPANVVVFDPEKKWTVDPMTFNSKSRNTPFAGRELTGKVVHTFFEGRHTVADGVVASGVSV
jgi:dihydroorotase